MPQARVDMSGRVLCDDCDRLFTAESTETGGMLFESKALCPTCTPKWMDGIKKHKEERYIRDMAEPGETFFNAVMRWRGGNNDVVITGNQADVDDMAENYRKRLDRGS